MINKKLKKEIERLVNEYSRPDSKVLFQAELEYLVLLAERKQLVEDRKFLK